MVRPAMLALVSLAACVPDQCPIPLSTYCDARAAVCPMTWMDAQDPSSWPCKLPITLKVCEDVWIATEAGADLKNAYYYNPKDGTLYRVEGYDVSTGATACAAGEGETFDCVTGTTTIVGTGSCP